MRRLKSTGEIVDVVDYNRDASLKRSSKDWVCYIDSNGNYHYPDYNNLNIHLDFVLEINNDEERRAASKKDAIKIV